VHLLGWSRGGLRAVAFAAKHPNKVDRLLLYAPGQYYSAQYSSTPPAPLPLPGVPTTILSMFNFHNNWFMLAFDPTGSTWARGGVRRAPTLNETPLWTPFNKEAAAKVVTPTLLINGDLDKVVPPVQVSWLYDDLIAVPQKILVHVACASHSLVFETQHEVLFDTAIEWLQRGTFQGQTSGKFAVDSKGQAQREATAIPAAPSPL